MPLFFGGRGKTLKVELILGLTLRIKSLNPRVESYYITVFDTDSESPNCDRIKRINVRTGFDFKN